MKELLLQPPVLIGMIMFAFAICLYFANKADKKDRKKIESELSAKVRYKKTAELDKSIIRKEFKESEQTIFMN